MRAFCVCRRTHNARCSSSRVTRRFSCQLLSSNGQISWSARLAETPSFIKECCTYAIRLSSATSAFFILMSFDVVKPERSRLSLDSVGFFQVLTHDLSLRLVPLTQYAARWSWTSYRQPASAPNNLFRGVHREFGTGNSGFPFLAQKSCGNGNERSVIRERESELELLNAGTGRNGIIDNCDKISPQHNTFSHESRYEDTLECKSRALLSQSLKLCDKLYFPNHRTMCLEIVLCSVQFVRVVFD